MSTTEVNPLPDAGQATEAEGRAAFVRSLRDLADFIESSTDVPFPDSSTTILCPLQGKHELAAFAKAGGFVRKTADDSWFNVIRDFGPIQLEAYVSRAAVCERVVVGQETVTIEKPDPDAPKIEETVTRDIIEWRCDEPLLAVAQDGGDAS